MRARGRRHVNRKALDQWTSFTEERERLRRRQGENARGEAKIRELIKTLDMRKDEAIERTFKARRPRCRRAGGTTCGGGRAGSVTWRALDRPQAWCDDLPGVSAGWRWATAQREVDQRVTC